jgi:tetratricopeptide (TPR) repeat protein
MIKAHPHKFFSNATFESLNIDFENGIVFDKDNNLLLLDGTNQSMRFASRIFKMPYWSERYLIDNIKRRKIICSNKNIRYEYFLLPNKETVFAENISHSGSLISIGRALAQNNAYINFIEIPYLIDGKLSFFKYDTHPCIYGNAWIAQEIFRIIGIDTLPYDFFLKSFSEKIEYTFTGDLGSRLVPKPKEYSVKQTRLNENRIFDNNIKNVGNIKIYTNNKARNNGIIIFGDSFFWNVAPYFSILFQTVVFVHSPYFHEELLEEYPNIDFVINANVERFAVNTLPDSARVNAKSLAIYKGKVDGGKDFSLGLIASQPKIEQHICAYIRHFVKDISVSSSINLLKDVEINDPETHLLLGRLLMSVKKYDDAIYHFKKAITMSPWIAGIYFNLSSALKKTLQTNECLKFAEMAYSLRPTSKFLNQINDLINKNG